MHYLQRIWQLYLQPTVLVIYLTIGLLTTGVTTKAQSAGQNSREIHSIHGLLNEGRNLSNDNPAKALTYFTNALQKSQQAGYYEGITEAYKESGILAFGNNMEKAIELGNLALDAYYRGNLSNDTILTSIHMLLAEAYDEKGKKDSAAYYFYYLSDEIENSNNLDPHFKINVYIKLAVFWAKLNYDVAYIKSTLSPYVEKAQQSVAHSTDKTLAFKLYFLQGVYYYAIKDPAQARFYYQKCLDKENTQMTLPRRISVLLNISETYLHQDMPKQALEYIEKAKKADKSHEYTAFYMSVADFMKAKALYQLKDYHAAINLIKTTFETAKSTNTPLQENAIEAQRILGVSYKALGMPAQALEQTEKYLQLYDSSMQKDKLDIITRLEVKYRLSEKNKELTLQKLTTAEAENSVRQKNFWLINITLLLVSLLLVFTLLHYHNLNKQRLQQEKINSIQQQMEIENLNATIRGEEKERSRIARELHDGIGGLLAGANMSLETFKTNEQHIREHADLDAGMKLLAEAAVELRKTAHNMMPEILLQIGLVEAIRHFCDNMNRTIPTNISFQALGEQRNFTAEFELAVYRIIQELLHNIVKHAHAKNAIVQISFHEKDFSITVEDDGVGMTDHHSSLKKGMGLTSIRERLKSIHGSILIQSAPDEGTSVNIEFELRENTVLV